MTNHEKCERCGSANDVAQVQRRVEGKASLFVEQAERWCQDCRAKLRGHYRFAAGERERRRVK